MNHNLKDRNLYPNFHIFYTSTNITVYTQGIEVKVGDTIEYGNKSYTVTKAAEQVIVPTLGERTIINPQGKEYDYNLSRPYVNDKTRFFFLKYEGELDFKITQDKSTYVKQEYRVNSSLVRY